jgi:hypothetical protein
MISTDDDDYHQSYPLIRQSKVRKLPTYTSSTSSIASSVNNSPNSSQQKIYYHHNGDIDEGYASFTTNNTTLGSHNSSTLYKDDSPYYAFGSERLLTTTTASSPRTIIESDSDKSEISDEDDELEDLVDWSSLNHQVQALVSRFDKFKSLTLNMHIQFYNDEHIQYPYRLI